MASTFAGGTLRVTTPSSYDASRPRGPGHATCRVGPKAVLAGKDALVAALEDAGLDQVERVDLTPRTTKDIDGKPADNRAGTCS